MNRAIYLLLIIYVLLLASLLSLHGELLALIIPPAIYLLAGYLRGPDELKLEVSRHLSTERAMPGGIVEVTVTIVNRGGRLEELLLEDVIPARLSVREGSPRSLLSLPAGGSHVLKYSVSGPRGGYVFEALAATANDHLAAVVRSVRIPASSQLFIFPPITRLRHVAIRPRRTRVYSGSIPARAGGAGIEFFGIRAYQPGDSSRSINWRASARHSEELYTNEFQQERVADVGIVLDGRLRTNAFGHGHSLFEYSVQAAAALSDAFIAQGNRVGLLLYANFLGWTLPAYGKVQRERILQALARAQPGASQVFSALEHIPTRLFPPESQIVVVSPLTDDDVIPLVQLRALGYQVMAISPDPVSFELTYLPSSPSVDMAGRVLWMERALLLQRLRRAGVQVLDWNVSQPFDLAIQQGLTRPPAWLNVVGS
ncbi:MAG: DUF58 domain-containing protein [Bacteroidota bacterium]